MFLRPLLRTGKTVDMFLAEICVQAQGMCIKIISSSGVETVVLLSHNG